MDLENSILKSNIQHLDVKLEHAKSLALVKELEMFIVENDTCQIRQRQSMCKRIRKHSLMYAMCLKASGKRKNTSSLWRTRSWQVAWLVKTWSLLHYKNTIWSWGEAYMKYVRTMDFHNRGWNLGSRMECRERKIHKLFRWKLTIAFKQGEDNGSSANGACKGPLIVMCFLYKDHTPIGNQFSKRWRVGCKEVSIAILARTIANWVHSLGAICCRPP